ncbi:MAG TPA: hypothetical protein VMX17_07305 [Candidatus Glassbacteria bacterium]|nr:hypothetical protein [Candidatus Glassbacteria bacterium]
MDNFLHYCLRVICVILIFSGIFAIGVLVGCEKNNDGKGGVEAPVLTPQWVKDFSELDKLCWQLSLVKNTDWTVRCIFDSGIPSVNPNTTIWETDEDLSKALSKALSKVKNQIGVDSTVLDENK